MRLYFYLIHNIILFFYKKEYKKYRNCENILKAQEKKLDEIIKNNSESLYGKKFKFSNIRSIKDFQENIPVTDYENYIPYIEKIKNGEQHILTYEKVNMFSLTSGSSSASKLIPYTDRLKKEFQLGIKIWLYSLYRQYPELKWGKSYWSITPSSDFTIDGGKVPVGFEEDSEYFGKVEKYFVDSLFVNPKVSHEKNIDTFYLKSLSCLLSNDNIRLFSFWSPSFLFLLLDYLENNSEKVLQTLKRNRRKKIEKYVFEKQYHKIWKHLKVISCWGEGNSSEYLKKIKCLFPDTEIQEKGLLSTEAFVSFPDGKYGNGLSYYSHFFEFMSMKNNKIYDVSKIRAKEKYEIIVTTSGGLYRYKTGDIIEVSSIRKGIPYIRFIGRRNSVSDLFGEKLNEIFLKDIMTARKEKIFYYMFAPCQNNYILYLKSEEKISAQEIEEQLRTNFHYDYCRKLGQLKPLKIFVLTGNPEKEYIEHCRKRGQKLGNIKMKILSKENNWEKIFTGYFQKEK